MYGIIKIKTLIIALALTVLIIIAALALLPAQTKSASAETNSFVNVPIIMYHSILKDTSQTGDYVITPDMLRSDFEYLKTHGYTSVSMSELISYVYKGSALPEKPVVITFDDGFLNNVSYAVPLLEEYSMKGLISVVGSYCDVYTQQPDRNLYYSYATWDDVKELSENNFIEIGNHSYNMHSQYPRKGASKMDGESTDVYMNIFSKDTQKMQNLLLEKSGIDCIVYTYPFGAVSEESQSIIEAEGFLASLACYESINKVSIGDKACLYKMGRYNRSGKYSTEDFMKKAGIA